MAAQLLEAFAALGGGQWTVEALCSASGIGIAPGDATPVLSGLAEAGVCAREEAIYWSTSLGSVELARLASILRGAEHYRRMRFDAPNLEFVVTMPMAPSHLEAQLPASPGRPGGYLSTPTAFSRLASSAQSRLVVLTPFIDGVGFTWLQSVFRTVPRSSEKMVVLRDAGLHAIDLAVHHKDWIRELGVSVRDYSVAHSPETGRALPIETFHAKIVVADDRLAYVGSANLLGSGSGTSLEAGVLVDGRAAVQVARLVEGILRIARQF